MTSLVELKQLIKRIYTRYEVWITPIWKFLLAFVTLSVINGRVGYLSALKPVPIVLMAALLCSFMPPGFLVLVSSVFILGHLYAVSIETLGVCLVLFMVMFLLYFRFGPGDTVVLVLTPLLFTWNIPYLMPLSLGLVSTPVSAMAMTCGVIMYYFLSYVKTNAATLGANSILDGGEDTEVVEQLRGFLTGCLTNRSMWVMAVTFVLVLSIVYIIRRLSVDHAWKIAILAGSVLNIVFLLVGDLMYDTKLPFFGVVVGTLVSGLVCFVLEFFFFHLDYSRTERVQFEDDDFYYYVKAVPKVAMATSERKVKKINRTHRPVPQRETETDYEDEDDDEDEVLRERVPMRTYSQPQASSRSSTARVRIPDSGRGTEGLNRASYGARPPVYQQPRTTSLNRTPLRAPNADTRGLSRGTPPRSNRE